MAVDIRATVTCSLGTLISGSISDDYLQGNGLIKTRGTAEISGTITPAVGTVVTFSYTKGGVTRNIPRKLRVISSFADPFRRTTIVELGCKLTYLSDLREPIDWTVFDDPDNSTYTEDDSRTVTLPIHASSVMDKCLTELGITASSDPLTNKFSVGEFDFSPGYVQVLSDLLVSECYFGYLDYNEVLQIVNLQTATDTGPLYTQNEIIDLGPINSGQLPGEAVTVSYSSLRLKAPEDSPDSETIERLNWERSVSINGPVSATIGPRTYTWIETTTTTTRYGRVNGQDVPRSRTTTTTGSTAKVAGAIGTSYSNFGILFNAEEVVLTDVTETFNYDNDGNVVRSEKITNTNSIAFFGKLSVDYAFSGTSFVNFPSSGTLLPTERIITTYSRSGSAQQEVSNQYVAWSDTLTGQQAVAEYRLSGELSTPAGVVEYLNKIIAAGLVYSNTEVRINRVGRTGGRPANVLNIFQSRDGDPANGYRLESRAELELALGSPTAQRRVEFSLPYAPDDFFTGPTTGPFVRNASDAPVKARNYGRIQNRLLLGNRNGMNLQLAPERLPEAPFASMHVQANGLTAQYRANGNQWAFDSNGIACSTDALFWAAVGGTGTFWFPVAPGITTLPATPAPVNGELTPTTLTLPYNETTVAPAVLRLTLDVTKFNYALNLLTEVPAITTRLQVNVSKVINAEAATYVLAGQDATLSIPIRVLSAASGAFQLSPKFAYLRPLLLAANTGTFALSGQDASFVRTLGIRTGTEAPLLGAGGAVTFDGWTQVLDANINNSSVSVDGWPHSFTINSVSYEEVFVGSNTYLTFGGGSGNAISLSASNPSLPKIHFGAADNSMQRVYSKSDIAGDGSTIMRIRYEGTAATTGTPGSPNIVAEFAFFEPRSNGDQWVELRVGNHSRTTGVFMIARSNASYASATITANSSWVFVGNSTGTAWTLTSNRYVD